MFQHKQTNANALAGNLRAIRADVEPGHCVAPAALATIDSIDRGGGFFVLMPFRKKEQKGGGERRPRAPGRGGRELGGSHPGRRRRAVNFAANVGVWCPNKIDTPICFHFEMICFLFRESSSPAQQKARQSIFLLRTGAVPPLYYMLARLFVRSFIFF